jgi:hypothetical protein
MLRSAHGASGIVLGTGDELPWLDFALMTDVMASPPVLAYRNLLDRAVLCRRGFGYEGFGLV